ncbi:MAG: dihydrofolate reductase [Clostridia bacterium]|nr:dihydrofolate reductase [Clostridia bacterium]
MKLIVAVDKEWGIGYKGDLLARVRADLFNFRDLTSGKIVILGSNTLATFPGGRALKNRTNIVLHPSKEYQPENTTVVHSIDELLVEIKKYNTDDVFVIGGASVYRQMLEYCDTAYITKFDKSYEKDVYFPNLDEMDEWEMVEKGDMLTSNPETDTEAGLNFYFTKYVRK